MRLSITTIEAYRMWRDGDWMSLDDLEATIRKETPENEAMQRGRAFHTILERPEDCRRETHYEAHGLCFAPKGIEDVLALLPAGRVSEVKSTYDLDGITLSGVADALHGLDVFEAKCTGQIDAEKYLDSFQWRAYLVMFQAARVRYILAQYRDSGLIEIPNVLPLPLYRYPKLEDDVRRLAHECAEFVVRRGLESYCVAREPETIAA